MLDPSKAKLRLLHTTKHSSLNFRQRLVYSYLVQRGDQGATKREIDEVLTLHRTKTLPAILNDLAPL